MLLSKWLPEEFQGDLTERFLMKSPVVMSRTEGDEDFRQYIHFTRKRHMHNWCIVEVEEDMWYFVGWTDKVDAGWDVVIQKAKRLPLNIYNKLRRSKRKRVWAN